jgi:hypothetical protein
MKVSKESFTHHGIIANGDIFVPNWDEIDLCDEDRPYYNKAKELMRARLTVDCRLMFEWDNEDDLIPETTNGTGYSLRWVDKKNKTIGSMGFFECWFVSLRTILKTNMLVREGSGDLVKEDLVRPKAQKISRSW